MKKYHYILFPLATLTAAIIFAACSKRDNEYKRKIEGQEQVLSNEEGIEDVPSLFPSPEVFDYLVRLEDSTLTLYGVGSEEMTVLKSINIDTSYYSYEDIEELNRGIPAYSKDDGFSILENFTN